MERTIKTTVFIATSLDGMIARLDGSIDWLEEANAAVPAGEDCGFGALINSVDVLIMGYATFVSVQHFEPWPYGSMPIVVLSRQHRTPPARLSETVSFSGESPSVLLARLQSEGKRHAYIDGGVTIQRFLQDGLIDRITITTIPIILGEGRALFGKSSLIRLRHERTQAYPFGFVQSTYTVVKPDL